MYYDVVCSTYEKNNKCDVRIDSRLLCGGLNSEEEALQYIDTHNCEEDDNSKVYQCIEIEEHNSDGAVMSVITID